MTTLGHFLGEIEFFRENIEVAIIAVIVVSLVPVAIEVYRSRKHKQRPQGRPRRRAGRERRRPTRRVLTR